MGVNAIRTSHNPPAPEFLEITDRLGVLVLDEAFDTWEQTKTTNDYGRYFTAWAQRDIQAMVRRDRNHPSVILWSIGNEVGGSTIATATNLKNWVLALDTTRPLTWASNKMGGPHVSEGDDRNVADLLDVVGYNYAPYAGDYDADHSAHPTWKLLGTEISAAVRSRGIYHTPAGTVTKATSMSMADRQCSSYDNEAAGFGESAQVSYSYENSRAFVAGSFIWAGFDYIGEPTPYSSWPSKSSYYGAIDTAGFPKDVYYFYKSRWTTAPMVHVLPHWNWSRRHQRHRLRLHQLRQRRAVPEQHVAGIEGDDVDHAAPRVERAVGVRDAARGLQGAAAAVVATDQVQDRRRRVARRAVGRPDDDPRRRQGPGVRHRRHPGRERRHRSQRGDLGELLGLRPRPAGRRRQRQPDRHVVVQGHQPQGVQRQGPGDRAFDRHGGQHRGDGHLRRVDVDAR